MLDPKSVIGLSVGQVEGSGSDRPATEVEVGGKDNVIRETSVPSSCERKVVVGKPLLAGVVRVPRLSVEVVRYLYDVVRTKELGINGLFVMKRG